MRIAAIQYRPPKARPDLARDQLLVHVRTALDQGATLVVAPEMATTGYVFRQRSQVLSLAEPADGATYGSLAPLARAHGAWLVVGFAELAGDALYNSAMVIGSDGRLAGVYRKNLLYTLDETWATPGTDRVSLTTPLGRLVPAICMDLNDDGFVRFVAAQRPDIIAFCTNWIDQSQDIIPYWRLRLAGWRGWFVAANTWGVDDGVPFRGRSAILDPAGTVVALGPARGDAVLVAEVPHGAGD